MSKKRRTKAEPKASPKADAKTEVQPEPQAAPKAEPKPEPKVHIPETPGLYLALARVVRQNFSVPDWLTLLAIYTGCGYEGKYKAENNPFGLLAAEGEPKNPKGYGFYPNVQFACSRFGVTVAQMGLDYSKPEGCIAKLKTRLPHIADIDYTLFTEAT